MRKTFRKSEAGFTLIELLVTVVIVGVLAAVAAPIYLGYVKDARMGEGKALAGSALTALQGCREVSTVANCDIGNLNNKLGLNAGNFSSGGTWQITLLDNGLNITGGNWASASANTVQVNGMGPDVVNANVIISLTAGVFSTLCQINGGTLQPC